MSDEERELPEGWAVAGYEGHDDWVNVEAGGESPTDYDLVHSYTTVVSYTDDGGNTEYFTIHGGVDEWEGLLDAIADLEDAYGMA